MKLVINIDDKTYKMIKDGLFLIKGGRGSGRIMEYNALKAIYDGTPLPKGHEIEQDPVLDKIRAEIASLDDADYDYEGYYKAVTDALKVIDKYKAESEPCEDAVSRQAVIDTIYHECSCENLDIDFAKVLLLQRKIKALPSVKPTQNISIQITEREKYERFN